MYGNSFDGRMLLKSQPKFKAPRVAKKKGADVAGIVEEDYGKYQIKAGRLSGTYIARAFPKASAKAQGMIAEAKGDSEEAAIAALKALIEARDVERTENRRWEEKSASQVANETEFLEALRQASLSQAQVAMLKAHAIAAEDGLTFRQLANAAGYKNHDTAAKVLRKAGALIADYLRIEVSGDEAADGEGAVTVLAFGRAPEEDAPTVWVMHEELRRAVRKAL